MLQLFPSQLMAASPVWPPASDVAACLALSLRWGYEVPILLRPSLPGPWPATQANQTTQHNIPSNSKFFPVVLARSYIFLPPTQTHFTVFYILRILIHTASAPLPHSQSCSFLCCPKCPCLLTSDPSLLRLPKFWWSIAPHKSFPHPDHSLPLSLCNTIPTLWTQPHPEPTHRIKSYPYNQILATSYSLP